MLVFLYMTKLSYEEVEHIAKLSKLKLSEEEKIQYQGQLSSVLNYVEQLREVDVEGVETTANVTGLSNVYRDDEISESGIGYQGIANNAPEFEDGSFVVPGVFES